MRLFALLTLFVLWVHLMLESEYEHWLVMRGDFEMIGAMWNWGDE